MSTESRDRSFWFSSTLPLPEIDSERMELLGLLDIVASRFLTGFRNFSWGERGENPQNEFTLEKLGFYAWLIDLSDIILSWLGNKLIIVLITFIILAISII